MSDDEDTSFVVQQAPTTFEKHGHGRDAFIEDASHALLLPTGHDHTTATNSSSQQQPDPLHHLHEQKQHRLRRDSVANHNNNEAKKKQSHGGGSSKDPISPAAVNASVTSFVDSQQQ